MTLKKSNAKKIVTDTVSQQSKTVAYSVYILVCGDNTLYTGITNDMDRRFAQHQAGTASQYTRARKVKKIAYVKACKNKSAALKREYAIKRLSRAAKLTLINQVMYV